MPLCDCGVVDSLRPSTGCGSSDGRAQVVAPDQLGEAYSIRVLVKGRLHRQPFILIARTPKHHARDSPNQTM